MSRKYSILGFVAWALLPGSCVAKCFSAETETYAFGDKCYVVYPRQLSWEQTVAVCQQDGGTLAMFNGFPTLITFVRKSLRSLPGFTSEKCMWIGVSDRSKEGDYKWLDGSSVASGQIEWDISGFFVNWMMDCGQVCINWFDIVPMFIKILMRDCDERHSFVCQFEMPRNHSSFTTPMADAKTKTVLENTTGPVLTDSIDLVPLPRDNTRVKPGVTQMYPTLMSQPTKSTLKHKEEEVPKVNQPVFEHHRAIIQKMDVEKLVTSQPLWTQTVHALTMCVRHCSASHAGCKVLNYNRVTKECRAFGFVGNEDRVPKSNWELWLVSR